MTMAAKDMQMIADRWMMESRRLVNWGSYEGYHEFRPSTDGRLPGTLPPGARPSPAAAGWSAPCGAPWAGPGP